ncbi:hypothetical protein PF007_g24744 [Phytophthora fragariae]|uniref:VLIG-type G domain-containing protein n=3 Tax=Phytophthora fragariae TaxID=53985 RepID=A0A6A3QH77_9STRA|nr:hypothetical protein PF007_g24744 [Phytophthora fragariae]
MGRKKIRRSAVVSDFCFRLLRLKHEAQNDARVMKVVVDQVDVLRLCRSLGMSVSDEGNRAAMHEFEFGMIDPSKYDADFARFLREKLAVGGGTHHEEDQEDESRLEIGCLFGKQEEVKAQLVRMGFWSSECEDCLSLQEQGVYCIKKNDGSEQVNGQFAVFAWMSAGLFEPELIRDTPAYILRFLMSLSSSITCCLSPEDIQRIRSEAAESSGPQWDSSSIAFQVQKQEEQSDHVSCGRLAKSAIAQADPIKKVSFVGGVFPAIVVESAVSSTTEWVTECELVPMVDLPVWLMDKQGRRSVQLPRGLLRPTEARDSLLESLGHSPTGALNELHQRYALRHKMSKQCSSDGYGGRMTRARLRMPERLQENMAVLSDAFDTRRGGLWGVVAGAMRRFLSRDGKISKGFRYAMEHHQTRVQRMWLDTVEQIMPKLQSAMRGQRIYQSGCDREKQFYHDEDEIKDGAFDTLRQLLLKGGDHKLSLKISQFRFTQDCSAVKIKWSEEVEKDPREVLRIYQLGGADLIQVSLLGDMEFEPGAELRELATVKTCQVIAVLVKEGTTIVRRLQFPLQLESEEEVEAEASDVRTFPRVCSMCSIRASDRRVVFTFGADVGRLGSAVCCRFNESFTSVEAMRSIDLDATFRLTAPFADILLTERSLCVMDENGHMQSFDIRTRQTSKRTSFENTKSKASGWQGGLLSFADELVIGRASINDSKQLRVDSISSEDHRQLPSVIVLDGASSEDVAVGCMDDVLYVVDGGKGVVFAAELNVTVRSEAYRIQQSGIGARSSRSKSLQADPGDTENEHWLRVFYHVFEKFPARSLVDEAVKPGIQTSVDLGIAVTPALNSQDQIADDEVVALCKDYFTKLMLDLRRLNKPLSGLDLTKTITSSNAFESRSVRRVVMAVISFVPVQICRAEGNMLKLLHNGEDISRADASSDSGGTEASEIAQSIRFGLLSPLLESWGGRCAVVTSMGKQSTGKSYFLNHLAGTSFAISGSRCTDGAWMSLRFVTADVLLVVLDFEGLGSFERSEQEDIFLSVLNASVSYGLPMESRFDKDIDGLFSRFQKGVQLIKNDPRLFRGLLYMSVKDVNSNDRRGVYSELGAKLNAIFKSSREQNFLTEIYAGNLRISCAPPFGTMEYYQSMERDTATNLLKIVAPFEKAAEEEFP